MDSSITVVRLLNNSGIIQQGVVLEFAVTTQSNNLTYHKPYAKIQHITYLLIKLMYDAERLSYRKISRNMNEWGIPTVRGNKWFPQSVHSALKNNNLIIRPVLGCNL